MANPTKLVLLNLLERLGQNGSVWPTQETIGSDTNLGDRQVRTALRELEDLTFLSIRRRGQGRPNVYVLHIDQILRWAYPRTGKSALQEVPHTPLLPIEDQTKEDPPVKAARARLAVSQECRTLMAEKYPDLNEPDTYEAATNHVAFDKAKDKDIYYARWCAREVAFRQQQPRKGGQARGPSSRDPEAFLSAETRARPNVHVYTE